MDFYTDMHKKGMLKKKDYDDLKKYWNTIQSDKCPSCGKKKLEWVN